MKTICIQIGNSDDKLTQREWASFVSDIRDLCALAAVDIHFFGGSENYTPWQNACWVVGILESDLQQFRKDISDLRVKYGQDSVAYLEGTTVFI